MTTKKVQISSSLIDNFNRINMDTPINYDEILDFVFEDVCETADQENWNDADVVIGFRRWIESKQ